MRRWIAYVSMAADGKDPLPVNEVSELSDPIDENLSMAMSLIRSGRSAAALPVLDSLVLADPASFLIRRERIFARKFTGDLAGALRDCDILVSRWPEEPEAYTERADVHARARNVEAAIADCTEAVSLKPDHEFAYLARGRLRMQIREISLAVADFTIHIAQDRMGPLSGLLNRGRAQYLLGDVDGAIEDLTLAISLELGPVFSPLYRGTILHREGDLAGAVRDYTLALERYPELTNALRLRAEARASLGDTAGAEVDMRRYNDLGGQDLPAYRFEHGGGARW